MRHYAKIKVERKIKELVKTTCDKCNEAISDDENNDYSDFTLNYAIGKQYPDGGYGDGWCVDDLCDSCADDLKHLLMDNGYKVIEYDY